MSQHTQTRAIAAPLAKASAGRAGLLQRKCACGSPVGLTGQCEECDGERLTPQRSAAAALSDSVPHVVQDGLHSSGLPLDHSTRARMESRFGHDFGRVRVHTDERAAESARAMTARAYTLGEDIVFGRGLYNPASADGSRLLMHELTHVVQHRSASSAAASGLPALEAEADAASRSAGLASVPKFFGRAVAGAPLCDVTESQLARPSVIVVSEGDDDIIIVNGVRAFRVRHVVEGQKVQRVSGGGGSYTRLKGKEYSPAKGISISWRWSIPLTYRHAARVVTLPGGTAQLRNLFPSVEFLPVVTEAPKPVETPKPVKMSQEELEKRTKLRAALREVGRKDLDTTLSPFDDPEFKGREKKGRQTGWAQEWEEYGEQQRAEARAERLRKQIDAGLSLIDSVSKTHWSSRAEMEKYIDDFIAAASHDPAKLAQAQKDKKLILDELKETQTDLVEEDSTRARGEQWADQQVATIRSLTPTPIPVQMHAAIGEKLVLPTIKGVDFMLDFVPYLGPVKMLLEAIMGRTVSGQLELYMKTGKGLSELPQDLDTLDRLIRVIPFAISAASKIVTKAPGWAESLSKLRKGTKLADNKLVPLVEDMAKLAGREREIVRALIELRAQRLAQGSRLPSALANTAGADAKVVAEVESKAASTEAKVAAAESEAAAGAGKVTNIAEAQRIRARKAARTAEVVEESEQKLASGDRARASSGGSGGKKSGRSGSGGGEDFEVPGRRPAAESSGSGDINVLPDRPPIEVEGKLRGVIIERQHLDSMPHLSRPRAPDFKGIDAWSGGKEVAPKILPNGQKMRTITKADVFQVKSVGGEHRIVPEVNEGLRGLEVAEFTSPTDKSLRVINPNSRTLDVIFEEGAVELNARVRALLRAQSVRAGNEGVLIRWFRWAGGKKTRITNF